MNVSRTKGEYNKTRKYQNGTKLLPQLEINSKQSKISSQRLTILFLSSSSSSFAIFMFMKSIEKGRKNEALLKKGTRE